jgi:hypothetical protein
MDHSARLFREKASSMELLAGHAILWGITLRLRHKA